MKPELAFIRIESISGRPVAVFDRGVPMYSFDASGSPLSDGGIFRLNEESLSLESQTLNAMAGTPA